MKYNDSDKRLSLILTVELAITAIKYCIIQSIPNQYLYNDIFNLVVSLVMLVIMIPAIKIVIKRKLVFSFLVIIVFSIYFIINFYLYESNRELLLKYVFRIYSVSIPCMLIAFSINKYNFFIQYLKNASYLILLSGLFMLVQTSRIGVVGSYESEYNMSLSYYMVIPTIIMFYSLVTEKKIKYLIFSVIGLGIIIAMGSRGTLICISLFCIMYIIKFLNKNYTFPIKLSFICIIATILVININNLMKKLYDFFVKFNINSRTLSMFLSNDISNSTGRDEISKNLINKIYENPITGIGFLGEKYSHNIIIENLLFNGVIIGSIIISILLFIIIKALLFNKNHELSLLIIIFFSYSIPDSLLNLSVWGQDRFWIFIGLSLSAINYSKINRHSIGYNVKNINKFIKDNSIKSNR